MKKMLNFFSYQRNANQNYTERLSHSSQMATTLSISEDVAEKEVYTLLVAM
jgi:hypothetical protein